MNTLIACFSYTGHTRGIARQVRDITGGTLFEIRPAVPYTRTTTPLSVRAARKPATATVRPWRSGPI